MLLFLVSPMIDRLCLRWLRGQRSRLMPSVLADRRSRMVTALTVLLVILTWPRVAIALTLRVAIEESTTEATVGSSTDATVRDANGNAVGRIAGTSGFVATANHGRVGLESWSASELTIEPDHGGFVFIGDRWYRGQIQLKANGSRVTVIDRVDLDAYLYAVLGAEMSPSWPAEALKAQAVAARTYALYQRNKRRTPDYDLGDDTRWQVYRGIADEADSTRRAVDATRDRILTHNRQPIEAVFHSSAGGYTESSEFVWSEARPYLQSVPAYDEDAPDSQWQVDVSAATLANLAGGVGAVQALRLDQLTPGGRAWQLAIVGSSRSYSLSGVELRSALGLPSAKFEVSRDGDRFVLHGRGRGHGVGMSQWGARRLAERGYDYAQIVTHYYQGSSLSPVP
jgi:stage II sporulation protein D